MAEKHLKENWFGLVHFNLVWFGMGFCGQDRKAMSGELVCQFE